MRLARQATAELVGTAFLVAAVDRLGDRRPAALPRGCRPAAAREQPDHRGRAGRPDPRPAAGVGRLQPGRHAGRAGSGRRIDIGCSGADRRPARGRGPRRRGCQPDVRPRPPSTISLARPHRRRAVARRGRSDARPGRRDLRQSSALGGPRSIAFAVGGYITAAYWFTSSTSFANPAVTVARMFSDTFAGIAPASVPMFILMQLLGGALAYGLVRLLYPQAHASVNPLVAEVLAGRPVHGGREADQARLRRGRGRRRRGHDGWAETCPIFPGKRFRTGRWTIPQVRTSTRSGASSTTSTAGFASSSPSSGSA